MEKQRSLILENEGEDQQRRFSAILKLAKSKTSKGGIQETALVEDRPFQDQDIRQIRFFLESVAPYTGEKLFPNYWEHILLTSIYASVLAETVGSINPRESEAVGLLHDVGRLVVPHRYGRNDLVGKTLLIRAGVRPEIIDSIAPLERILGIYDPIKGVEDLTLVQKINHIADNLGKKNADGQLLSVEDVMNLSSGRRYTNPIWASERSALSHLNQDGKEDWANRLVCNEALYFMIQNGVDFDEVRKTVEVEFGRNENQDWLKYVQNIPKLKVDLF